MLVLGIIQFPQICKGIGLIYHKIAAHVKFTLVIIYKRGFRPFLINLVHIFNLNSHIRFWSWDVIFFIQKFFSSIRTTLLCKKRLRNLKCLLSFWWSLNANSTWLVSRPFESVIIRTIIWWFLLFLFYSV